MERKISNEPKFKLIYLFRQLFPTSDLFYIIFFFFKFYGIILTTHNLKGYENKSKGITSISSILSRLSFYNTNFRFIVKSYSEFCIIIFILLCIFFIGIFIDYHFIASIYKKINTGIELKIRKIGRFHKKEPYKILSIVLLYLYLFLLIFGQHMIIYISPGIFIPFLKNDIDNNSNKYSLDINSSYFNTFINSSSIPITFLAIINILSCIMLYILFFSFIQLNNAKGIFSIFGKKLYLSNQIIIITFITFLFLPFISIANIFQGDDKNKFRLLLNICGVFICSIYILMSVKNFNSNCKIVIFFNNFIIIWCWFSGIIEILLYHFIKNDISQVFYTIKLLLQLLNSIGICLFIYHKNNQFFEVNFSKHLFQTNEKNFSIGEIFIYLNYLKDFLNHKQGSFFHLYRLLFNHKKDCLYPNCPCSIIKFEENQNLNMIQTGNKLQNEIHFEISTLQSTITTEQFIIIGEQEIVNRIMILFRKKLFGDINFYCICHVYYIYYFKKNLKLALYFAGKYFESQIKFNFTTLYFFYEIKKQIIKEIYNKSKNRKIKKNDGENNLIKLKVFFDFIVFILTIKTILKYSCIYLENIFRFQKESNKNNKLSTINYSSFLEFLHSCGYISNYNKKLKYLLIEYYRIHQDLITNKELCYLLTNYYYLIFKNIPDDISIYFEKKYTYNSVIDEIEFDYEQFLFKYPLITGLSKSDNFEIFYFHNKLCEYLEYSKEQIIGKDFHTLIPIEINEPHKLILKQFLFIPNAVFSRNEAFILNKDRYIVNCSFSCKLLPKFKSEFYIIANIEIVDLNTLSCLNYSLMLNSSLHFITISKSFEEQFFFNLKMFEILKINFCDFFGVSTLKLKKRLNKKKRNSINTRKKILRNLIEENHSLSILSNVSQDKIFVYRVQKNSIDDLLHTPYEIEDTIKKAQIINGLQNLTKTIDEIGLDIDWYNRVKCLGERLQIANFFDYHSNIIREENDLTEQFNIKYTMKEIGIYLYYVVQIMEFINVNEVRYETENIKKKLSIHPHKERKSALRLELHRSFNVLHSGGPERQNSEFSINSNKVPLHKGTQMSLIGKLSNYSSFEMNSSNTNDSKNVSNNNLIHNNSSKRTKRKFVAKKTIKDSNNEEIEILTGEKMEILLDEIHHTYSILKFILLLLFIILLVLEIITVYLRINIKNKGNNLLKNNIYFQLLKTDIYVHALSLIYFCDEIIDDEESRKIIMQPLFEKYNSILIHYSKVMKYLGKLNIYKEMNSFISILYDEISFQIIKDDWKVYTRQSGLIEEINIYQYSISSLISNFKISNMECRLKQIFFNENFMNETKRKTIYKNEGSPSEEEEIFFYSLYNIIQNYKPKFEKLSNQMNQILIDFINEFTLYYVIIINIIIMIVLIAIISIYIKMLFLDKKEMKVILNHLYVIDPNQYAFEQQVMLFKNIILEFNEKKISLFERAKLGKIFINSSTSTSIKTKPRSKESIFKLHSNNKNNNSSTLDMIPQETPHTNLSRKPMNPHNNNNNNNENNENHEIVHEVKAGLLPKTIKLGLVFIIIFILILLFLLGFNIYTSLKLKKNFIRALILCLNFLDRLPRAIELMLYTHLSIIAGNPYLIKGNGLEYYKTQIDEYLNYYNYELDYERASQIESLSDSYYSNLFLENILIKTNIDEFVSHPLNILNNIKEWQNKFNYYQYFCLYSGLGQEIYLELSHKNIKSFFTDVNYYVNKCYNANNIINEYGLETEFNYFYQELTNLYKDFCEEDKSDNRKIKLLNNVDKTRIVKDIVIQFKFVFDTFSYWFKHDLKKFMSYIGNLNNYFFGIIIIISLIMFVVIYIIIQNMNDETKRLLLFFSKLF